MRINVQNGTHTFSVIRQGVHVVDANIM